MDNVGCGECRVWRMPGVENARCGEYRVQRMPGVENAGCREWRVWRIPGVEKAELTVARTHSAKWKDVLSDGEAQR